jgi:hypothetical protein
VRVTAYTVILEQYDNLRRPRAFDPADRYVCFTDRPRNVAPWQTQGFPMLFGADAARNCRIPKCLPHLMLPDTDISIYMDGAFLPLIPISQAAEVLGDADIALFPHPGGHASYHDERNFYQKLHGHVPDDVESTYQRYVAEGLPVTGRFYAGGLVIRRHTPKVAEFNELWFREYVRGSYNDQFGLYYAIVKSGVKVATIPGVATMDTQRFGYCLHANSGCGDNPQHEAENKAWSARFERIRELCR